MHKSDTGVELRIAGHSLLDSGHSNQHEPNAASIEDRPHLLKADDLEPIGFIHQNQPGWIADALLLCDAVFTTCGIRRLQLWYETR